MVFPFDSPVTWATKWPLDFLCYWKDGQLIQIGQPFVSLNAHHFDWETVPSKT
jgi:hypothetical protein